LLDRLCAAVQRVKNFVIHSRADDERRRVSEPQLLQAFGRRLFRLVLFHR
jgi:hypothetical protein